MLILSIYFLDLHSKLQHQVKLQMTLEMLSVSEIGRRMFKVINFAQTNIGKQSSSFGFFKFITL